MTAKRNIVLQAIALYSVVVLCKANESEPLADLEALGSWFRDRFGNVSNSINDIISRTSDVRPAIETEIEDSHNLNASRKAPFWDPSEWRLWNATNGLLKKSDQEEKSEVAPNHNSNEPANQDIALPTNQSHRTSFKESLWQYFGALSKMKRPWGRTSVNSTDAREHVADPSGVKNRAKADPDVIGDKNGDGIVDVNLPAGYESGGLLPGEDILEGLKCRPTISFSSCFQHCLTLVVPSGGEEGYSLTHNLMNPQVSFVSKRLLSTSDGNTSSNETSDGRSQKKAPSKYMPDDSQAQRSFDLWEVAQVKNCVVSVCTADYIKTPLPGCLDGNGDIVLLAPDRAKPLEGDRDPRVSEEYRKLDFYDPGRLEFWHGMGFFTLQRVWFDIVHGRGLFRLVLLPCAVMLLLSLPMFLLALIVPGMTPLIPGEGPQDPRPPASRPGMSLQAMDIDDYGEVIHPSSIRLCDATFANSKLFSYLKLIVDGLTLLSSRVSGAVNSALMRGSGLFPTRSFLLHTSGGLPSAPGVVEMVDRSHMKYSPLPSSELIPAEEEAERGKRCPPGSGTTLPSTGKTLPSPTHEDRMYFHRFQ